MSKKKLAILSTYGGLCGNASYTKALAQGFAKNFDVTVIPLDAVVMRSKSLKTSSAYVTKLCTEIQKFDYVNIQFEPSLFGLTPKAIWKNAARIIKSCKKLVLTLHRYDSKKTYPGFSFFASKILQRNLKTIYGHTSRIKLHNKNAAVHEKTIKLCKKLNVPVLVHTKRDSHLIKSKYNYDHVFDHPICFYTQTYIDSLAQNTSRETFCETLALDPKNTYIGIFGFIAPYKGYECAIQALLSLPENYVLLIFGGQNYMGIVENEPVNSYIRQLTDLISLLKLKNRVIFCGSLSDDAFVKALFGCDFNILPYVENNQSGSAIAALSLETNSRTIFSQNFAFMELARYAEDCFRMFTIGNHLELADAIERHKQSNFATNLKNYHENYNIDTSIQLYTALLTQ